jgi:hypothetical protein
MSVDTTVDDVLRAAGAKTRIVILPDRPARTAAPVAEPKARLRVLARAKPIAGEHPARS